MSKVSDTKPKRGRPRRERQIADVRVSLRLTLREARAWKRSAGKTSLAEWIRARGNAFISSDTPATDSESHNENLPAAS